MIIQNTVFLVVTPIITAHVFTWLFFFSNPSHIHRHFLCSEFQRQYQNYPPFAFCRKKITMSIVKSSCFSGNFHKLHKQNFKETQRKNNTKEMEYLLKDLSKWVSNLILFHLQSFLRKWKTPRQYYLISASRKIILKGISKTINFPNLFSILFIPLPRWSKHSAKPVWYPAKSFSRLIQNNRIHISL